MDCNHMMTVEMGTKDSTIGWTPKCLHHPLPCTHITRKIHPTLIVKEGDDVVELFNTHKASMLTGYSKVAIDAWRKLGFLQSITKKKGDDVVYLYTRAMLEDAIHLVWSEDRAMVRKRLKHLYNPDASLRIIADYNLLI